MTSVTRWVSVLGIGLGLLLPATDATAANGYRVVHEFTGDNGTGRGPTGSLVQGPDGKLHGTATYGGASRWGDVFRLSTSGTVKVMHSFKKDGPNGPLAGLTLSQDGNLYGTTAHSATGSFGGGAVFRMSLAGDMTILHEFDWHDGAGESPNRVLLEASNGSLYGTSRTSGEHFVWRMAPSGEVTAVHEFTVAEGFEPSALVEGPDGLLYGVAQSRGAYDSGSVFRMTLDGTLTVLHHFDRTGANAGAAYPNTLMLSADGHFYGTTTAGGRHGKGAVFRMSPAGDVTLLHEFEGGASGGASPVSPLLQATNGNFYGTTDKGGTTDWGVVYRLSPDGRLKVLHHFSFSGGRSPTGALLQASDGRLYGTALGGEDAPAGIVYSLKAN